MKKMIFMMVVACWSVQALAGVNPGADLKSLRTMGADNPTKIYLFSSFSCPHCNIFHKDVLPALEQEFVEPGKAQLVFVDMPSDGKAMAGSLIARCASPAQYEPFVSAMYAGQTQWMNAPGARDIITGYAKLAGMTEQEITVCLGDKELQKAIMNQRENLSKLYNVKVMPALVLVKDGNRKMFTGTNVQLIRQGLSQELSAP